MEGGDGRGRIAASATSKRATSHIAWGHGIAPESLSCDWEGAGNEPPGPERHDPSPKCLTVLNFPCLSRPGLFPSPPMAWITSARLVLAQSAPDAAPRLLLEPVRNLSAPSGQRPGTSQPRASEARALPWVICNTKDKALKGRGKKWGRPFRALFLVSVQTQGAALGWLVCAPLVLPPSPHQSAVQALGGAGDFFGKV